jgi:hypothetical protein
LSGVKEELAHMIGAKGPIGQVRKEDAASVCSIDGILVHYRQTHCWTAKGKRGQAWEEEAVSGFGYMDPSLKRYEQTVRARVALYRSALCPRL